MSFEYHVGRASVGHHIEDACPCRQAVCGLVDATAVDPACPEHSTAALRPMGQIHQAALCPGWTRGRGLSDREIQVLAAIARGRSNAEIGREMFLSPHTVKSVVVRVFRLLGARDRAHAVALGYRAGLLSVHDETIRPVGPGFAGGRG